MNNFKNRFQEVSIVGEYCVTAHDKNIYISRMQTRLLKLTDFALKSKNCKRVVASKQTR